VDQASGGWLVSDAEQTNELGLPLVRGPFATLDEARDGMEAARRGPAPISSLTDRIAAQRTRAAKSGKSSGAAKAGKRTRAACAARPELPPVAIREY
jgi:hypothetical protein